MKTECPITRREFADTAKAQSATIAGSPVLLDAKEFSTGSLGFGYSGKIVVDIGGKPVKVQLSVNATVIGSKELPKV